MNNIIFPIKTELENFEIELKKVIASCDNFLSEDLNRFMFSSPKRLRPIFIFLFAKILKIENSLVEKIAIITEIIHSASLIHDDIIDNEKIRRNNLTFSEKYNSKLAVLEGDLLLALALEEISQTTLDISKIFSNRIKKTIQGEIKQNENLNKIDIEFYFEKTLNKTANLFLAGLEALFTLKVKNDNLFEFMKNYSMAFQIKNDIDNFKKNSSDYINGNYTLPVIYFFLENKSLDNFQNNADFYIKKANNEVENYIKKALDALDNIENSKYKNALIDLSKHLLRS